MHRMLAPLLLSLGLVLLALPAALAEGEEFEAITPAQVDEFYSRENRRVMVDVSTADVLHDISSAFLGVDLSYFNATDEIWEGHGFNEKLRRAGVGSLRYPGGHETGFFHWEHPGVNGYEDRWAPKEQHGYAPYRGPFQTTWVHPDEWDTNESFMDFDQFMEACHAIGAEPVVGINLSSGRKYDRYQEGIDMALRWLRYCEEQGYDVKYWFLECEPWHKENNYTFTDEEYIEDTLAYGRALKAEFPDIKLITNPLGGRNFVNTEWLAWIIGETKEVVDYIDIHWYWAWHEGSFDHWLEHTPIGFHHYGPRHQMGYAEGVEMIREAAREAGAPDMGVMVLEWNIAPSNHTQTFRQSLTAVIHGEILMEYMRADVEITNLWTLLWSSRREVWSEQDYFPGIVTLDPPYEPTLSLDLFRLLSPVQGAKYLQASADRDDMIVASTLDDDVLQLYNLNKNVLRRRVTVNLDRDVASVEHAEYIALKHHVTLEPEVELLDSRTIRFFTEPFSFNAMTLKLEPAED